MNAPSVRLHPQALGHRLPVLNKEAERSRLLGELGGDLVEDQDLFADQAQRFFDPTGRGRPAPAVEGLSGQDDPPGRFGLRHQRSIGSNFAAVNEARS